MYKKGIKRVFSLFLSIALVLSLFTGISLNVNAEEDCYTIKFDANGGSGTQEDLKISKDANSVTIPNCEFKRDGYTFMGWKCDGISMDNFLFSPQEITPSMYSTFKSVLFNSGDTVTFVAQWEDNSKEYTINFDANGGSGSQASITGVTYSKWSTTVVPQCNFTKKGYTFDRWTTNPDGTGASYTANSLLSSYAKNYADASGNITLYAQWQDANRKFNVVFDGNGATSGTTASMNGLTSDKLNITMPQCGYKKDGYTFLGWTTSPGNYYVSKYYMSPGTILHLSASQFYQSDTVTFYAVWWNNNDTFTINFDGNGGTGTTASITGLTVDQLNGIKMPQCGFTRDGYIFSGWESDSGIRTSGGSVLSVPVSAFNDSRELTFHAKWQDDTKKYTINFDGNGNGVKGNVAPISATYSQLQKGVVLPDNGYSWAGHTFRGWNTKKDGSGTTVSSISSYLINTLFAQSDEATLYAQWWDDNKTYTASFDGNGATSGTMQAISGLKRTSYIQLPDCKYKKTGYEFAGWILGSNGTGQVIQPGKIISLSNYNYSDNANVEFYAKWVDNSKKYGITFNANGGSGTMTAASGITVGDNYIIPKSNFTKSGYTFKNWNTKADGSGYSISPNAHLTEWTISYMFGSSNKITLYAQWANNNDSWEISYNGNGSTSGAVASTKGLKRGSTFTVPQCSFKKTGYNFNGWNTKANGTGILLTPGSELGGDLIESVFGKAGKYNLYAQWVVDDGARYQFTYDGNNPTSGTMSVDKNLIANSTYKISECQYKKTGYRFECWNTKKDGTGENIYPGMPLNQYFVNHGSFKAGNNTLYAKWLPFDEKSNKIIKFAGNGGSGSMASITISPSAKTYTIPDCKFTKKGYVFYAWNTKPDGTGLFVYPSKDNNISGYDYEHYSLYEDLFTGTNTVTLYPIWAVSSGEVKHDCSKDGHTYGAPVFNWSADGKTCTATYTCKDCKKKVTSKCKVTSKVKTAATCAKKGVTTYTATSGAYSSTKNVADIPINAKAHSYGAPVFKWSADGKTCTATYTCKDCKKKVTSKCKVTSKVKTNATCSKKGVTTYTATSGKYSSTKNVADIPMIAHTLVTKTTPATAKADGKIDKVCSVCNKTIKTTKINKIASMKVSNATYNKGQEVKPQVTVLDSKGSTINPKYYTVTYANNKEVGTGSVTVTFKGLYSGKLTKTFAVNPKATAVAKPSSPKKGQLKVNWKALPVGQTNGYQIQVSANANFKNAKTVPVVQKSKAVNAKTITGLKKGNYYIRIRTVKTDADGKTHYSSWAKYKNAVAVK